MSEPFRFCSVILEDDPAKKTDHSLIYFLMSFYVVKVDFFPSFSVLIIMSVVTQASLCKDVFDPVNKTQNTLIGRCGF